MNKIQAEGVQKRYRADFETLARAGIPGRALIALLDIIAHKTLLDPEDLKKELRGRIYDAKLDASRSSTPESEAKELRKMCADFGNVLDMYARKDFAMRIFWRGIFKLDGKFNCWIELARVRNAVFRANGFDEEGSDEAIAHMLRNQANRCKTGEKQ